VSFRSLLSPEPYQFGIHHIYWGFYGTMVDELKVWPGGGIDLNNTRMHGTIEHTIPYNSIILIY
jgi:hypothetical protein